MVIKVAVRTSSKEVLIKKIEDVYHISLKSKPFHNSANLELIDVLSSYFHIPKSSVKIFHGLKSKNKLIEIGEE